LTNGFDSLILEAHLRYGSLRRDSIGPFSFVLPWNHHTGVEKNV
jgi:hypothetical protein